MSYTPIDSNVLTGILNNQGTQATAAGQSVVINNQGTQATSALQTTGNAIATVMMNDFGSLATATVQATANQRLASIYDAQGTIQRTALYSLAGNPVDVARDSNGEYHLGVTAIQSVYVSTKNSYNGTLVANGGSFVGTAETTLGIAGIQVMFRADQNCTVYVDQSGDSGTNWDISDSYTYLWTKGGDSWTTQAIGDTFRVRVVNNAISPTTYSRLSTALCPVIEAVPRTLDTGGHFKTAVLDMLPTFNTNGVMSTPYNAMRVTESNRLAGALFGDSVVFDTNFWGSTAVGTGTIIPGGGQATLQTGATAASSGTLISVRNARYVAAHGNFYRAVLRIPSTGGTCRRRWGAYTSSDGFYFEYDGTTLSVVARKNSVVQASASSGSFNGDQGTVYTLDGNAHTFEVYWTNKSAWFLIDDAIIHKLTGSTATLTSTITLPVAAEVANLGATTTNNQLEVRTASINRLGPLATENIYKYINSATTTVCKYGAGRLHRVILNAPNSQAQNISIYDSTGGTTSPIALLVLPNINNQVTPPSIEFNCPFFNGLTVVTSQANAVTVIYE